MLRKFSHCLRPEEQDEIKDYRNIYYIGHKLKKEESEAHSTSR